MPSALTFLSFIALMILVGMTVQIKTCPPVLVFYLAAQAVFTGACWVSSQKWSNMHDSYSIVYCVTMMPPLLLALGVSVLALAKGNLHVLVLAELALLTALSYTVMTRFSDGPWEILLVGTVASVFITSGLFLILSLVVPSGDALWDSIRLKLGLFLLAQGGLHWLLAPQMKGEMVAVRWALWFPGFIACAILGWMGYSISRMMDTVAKP